MSIKIENIQTMGWEGALRGMRNPLNSWDKADSAYASDIERTDTNIAAYGTKLDRYDFVIGQNDLALCLKLIKAGSEHRKFLRMIHVQMDITAPLYWWKEFDTYKVATTSNSCSTMHKIAAKPFGLEDFSHEHIMHDDEGWNIEEEYAEGESPLAVLEYNVTVLNFYRKKYLETKTKPMEEEVKRAPLIKAYWQQMIQLLPSSYNQKRTVMLNYEVLANIYKSRKDHKLDEWRDLCTWIEGLPYSELITGGVKK